MMIWQGECSKSMCCITSAYGAPMKYWNSLSDTVMSADHQRNVQQRISLQLDWWQSKVVCFCLATHGTIIRVTKVTDTPAVVTPHPVNPSDSPQPVDCYQEKSFLLSNCLQCGGKYEYSSQCVVLQSQIGILMAWPWLWGLGLSMGLD